MSTETLPLNPPLTPPRNGLATLALVVTLLALPFAIGGGLYALGWQPARSNHHGHLHTPTGELPATGLRDWQGQAIDTSALPYQGKWLLVLNQQGPCDQACIARLDEARRIHVSLYKLMGDMKRVVITDHAGDPALSAQASAQPDLRLYSAPKGWLATRAEAAPGSLHLLDPSARLVMDYLPGVAAKDIRSDLERLLKFAWKG